MPTVELFYDHICPFCYRSFLALKELKGQFPKVDISFEPCEIHPRPEQHGRHSDLCIQGMYVAREHGIDLWEYNQRIFDAHFVEHINIEDLSQLADAVKDLINPDVFITAIKSGQYEALLQKANRYAFEEVGLSVVPHYKAGDASLPSLEGIGVPNDKLEEFLKKYSTRTI